MAKRETASGGNGRGLQLRLVELRKHLRSATVAPPMCHRKHLPNASAAVRQGACGRALHAALAALGARPIGTVTVLPEPTAVRCAASQLGLAANQCTPAFADGH